jgi:hypothetical protein
VRPFDPSIDLDGLWTVELARRYLPIEGMPPTRYEADNGRLRMSPREGSATSWAATHLAFALHEPALAAGHAVYLAMNVRTDINSWIEPELMILHEVVQEQHWIEGGQVLCPIEIRSSSSYNRDRIDKPAMCAQLGMPYYLYVGIRVDEAEVELLRLGSDGRYSTHVRAQSGELFETAEPFAMSFDPAELLESY